MGIRIGKLLSRSERKVLRSAGKNESARRHAAVLRLEDGMPVVEMSRLEGGFTTRNGVMYLSDGVTICGDVLSPFEAVVYPEFLDTLLG